MTWQFNPYAIPLFLSAIPLVVILYVGWRKRANLAAKLFLGFTGGALGLVLSYAMELLSANLAAMMFWLRWEYLFHWAMIFWPLFAAAYSGYDGWLTRRRVLSLFIVPVIIIALVWTNQWHGLIWSTTAARQVGSVMLFDRSYGAAFWVWMVYLASLFLAGNLIIIQKALRSPRYFQGQLGLLVVAFFLPAIAIVLTISRLTPVPLLDLSPYGVALACIPIAVSLFHFHLFDLLPAAYELVIESMGDAVIVCDDQSRIVQANQAAVQLSGKPVSKLVGFPVEGVFAEFADSTPVQRVFDPARAYQEIVVQVAGGARYFDLRISPLRNHQKLVTGQVFVLRDITDRKQAEQQAFALAVERERVRALETSIQDASHDFRTPISTILTSTHLLNTLTDQVNDQIAALSRPVTDAAARENFDKRLSEISSTISKMQGKMQATRSSAERLETLIESIIEAAQLERTPNLSLDLLDLNRTVDEQVQARSPAAARKHQQLQFEPDDSLPLVRVDPWKLGRAVQKLIDNAIQYTPLDGSVAICTFQRVGEAVIQISDTGIGIAADDLLHIFEPFYRADPARSTTTGGAGMGLSIARRIIEAHGGRIEAESDARTGSVFRICLPLNHAAPGEKGH